MVSTIKVEVNGDFLEGTVNIEDAPMGNPKRLELRYIKLMDNKIIGLCQRETMQQKGNNCSPMNLRYTGIPIRCGAA
ncbi:TPA: hypothetical protein EYP70_03170 [Candidatus Bathyarchaeota archaeon]|nr:hypothetical protein [Candidatus Bathyarchaeota archaeon]